MKAKFTYLPSQTVMSKRLRPHLRTTGSVKLLYLLKLVSFSVLLCLSSVWSQAQERMVTGVVRDGKGSPLPGVTVRVKNEKRAVMTDPNGNFRIPVSPGSSALVFSFVGFENQELPISNERMSVTLRESSKSLNEVVVVGYGTQRRAATTGAIASVKAADITQSPITNVAQGIQARVAGLQVTQNNAAPGGNISVRVRGTNSINGSSEPLYIIDGIQISNEGSANSISPLSTINPNDIESAEILKDASATAIYGARAANGVVLITTKRGKNGPTRVGLETYGGVQEVTKTLDLLNATQFAELENEIYKNAIYTDPASLGKGTDWQGEIFRKAGMQNHQLSINGGTEKTQFSLSANYFDQDGLVIRSDFKRYSLRLSLDHKVNDRFRIGTTILGSNSISNTVPTAVSSMDGPIATTSIIGAALAAPPSLVPYREDGSVLPTADQFNGRYREVANPVGLAQILNRTNLKRTLTNLYGEVNILKRLTYRASFNVDFSNSLNDYYSPLSIIAQVERNANSGAAQKNNRYTTDLLHESILTYNGAFGDHSLKVTGVFGTQSNTFSGNYINASGFPNDVTGNESVGIATNRTVSSEKTRARLDSYMGRINYGYRNRYFLDLTARVDGASKFGENNKYGFFPAAAVAWRLIEEQFMKDQKLFSDFKLRASYGVTGNAAAISPYQSLSLLNQGSDYVFNHVYTIGISPVGIANRDLQWEKSKQLNVGLDVSILNDRISLIADAYNKKTDGLLFVKNLPLSSGYASFPGNFASIENRGLEFALNARILDGKLKWNVNGNISFNRNKLVSLEGG
ncbi:SusC/RagA family TonB-linked outer membrane protein [Arcticibacter sp. MXS-1]|uniref:SusC/RagA family TonB-linked outer membrane protein n=1 Tax=Arcticibacter sp. MXS-1 TaxID=3341726 RepID=UPI0035A834D3